MFDRNLLSKTHLGVILFALIFVLLNAFKHFIALGPSTAGTSACD